MNKINWRQKLSSRKLWAAAAGVAAGLAVAFGLDEGTISAVAGDLRSLRGVLHRHRGTGGRGAGQTGGGGGTAGRGGGRG